MASTDRITTMVTLITPRGAHARSAVLTRCGGGSGAVLHVLLACTRPHRQRTARHTQTWQSQRLPCAYVGRGVDRRHGDATNDGEFIADTRPIAGASHRCTGDAHRSPDAHSRSLHDTTIHVSPPMLPLIAQRSEAVRAFPALVGQHVRGAWGMLGHDYDRPSLSNNTAALISRRLVGGTNERHAHTTRTCRLAIWQHGESTPRSASHFAQPAAPWRARARWKAPDARSCPLTGRFEA